jgi:hypothetical protein
VVADQRSVKCLGVHLFIKRTLVEILGLTGPHSRPITDTTIPLNFNL